MLSVVGSISLRGGSRMTTKALGALITAMGVVAGGLPAEAQGPIRIGASLSLTGTYAKLGRNQHEGYKLCVKDLNTKGGLLGRKVELVVYDDQSTPATAVRLYEKLITEDRVDGVMGPYSSPDRKSTRLNSSHGYISYAVFCLKKKKKANRNALTPLDYAHRRCPPLIRTQLSHR